MQYIRLLEEKNVGHEIDILLWSDRMDLVAFSNNKGEVAVHRLSWTRAWSLSPPVEGDAVKGMAWRPDGKVLAIAYRSGQLLLINVENKATLYSFEFETEITCIHWAQENVDSNKNKAQSVRAEGSKEYLEFLDSLANFVSPIPEPTTTFSAPSEPETETTDFFQKQTHLNLLLTGTKDGLIYISIFGCFTPIKVNVNDLVGCKCSIISVSLSETLNTICATVCDEEDNMRIVFINSEVFKTHKKELFNIAMKYDSLIGLTKNLASTISNVKEHWESILLELDSKLSKFASKVPEGTLATDFLDLLMYGNCTEAMQEFLLQDLTKKGLEKFGQTIEMSYINIQKLLLRNANKVGINMQYHLSDLRGMARLDHRYKVVGLEESKIVESLTANGSFLLKCGEMQEIITDSIFSYKAFFRWMYTCIMHLMDENVPAELIKGTQQDAEVIANFVLNFNDIGPRADCPSSTEYNYQAGFFMERLGQYLGDKPLKIQPKGENEWQRFVQQNECFKDHSMILKRQNDRSLVQQFNYLKTSIEDIFAKPTSLLGEDINLLHVINCCNLSDKNATVTWWNFNLDTTYCAFLAQESPSEFLYVIEFHVSDTIGGDDDGKKKVDARGGRFSFVNGTNERKECSQILDVKFYSTNVLSFLFQEVATKKARLCQLPFTALVDLLQQIDIKRDVHPQSVLATNGNDTSSFVSIDVVGMKAQKFAVSGQRKVSIVLSDTRRKVHLYEMEVDEEEEEDNELTVSTVRESDASAHENSDGE